MEQIGIGMILIGLAGILGTTGKMIYEEYGTDELIMAICVMITAAGLILVLIAYGQ